MRAQSHEELFPGLGRRDAAGGPREEAYPQSVFQAPNGMANGGRRNP